MVSSISDKAMSLRRFLDPAPMSSVWGEWRPGTRFQRLTDRAPGEIDGFMLEALGVARLTVCDWHRKAWRIGLPTMLR